jgi:Protein of unknown function (DUF4242)
VPTDFADEAKFEKLWPVFGRNLALGVRNDDCPLTPTSGERVMQKFMSSHTMPAGALKREQVDQMGKAALGDPVVKPYRSFLNQAEGKVFCDMEAPNKDALAAWFTKMPQQGKWLGLELPRASANGTGAYCTQLPLNPTTL